MSLRTTPKPIFLDFDGMMGEWVDDETPPVTYSQHLELESLEITAPAQNTVKLIGRRTSTLGQAIDSQNRATDSVASVAIKVNTFHPALLALAVGGSVAEASQSTGAITDELVTTVLDIWVPLANDGIAADGTGTEIALKTGADVAVSADKYEIDLELGMIRALHADAVGEGMKISYHLEARTWEQYEGGAATSRFMHITGQARNDISGKVGRLDIWRANLAPDGAFMIPTGEKHFQGSFKGDLITPTISIRGFTPTKAWRFRDRTA
jgi:hypothetical protein